MAKLVLIKDFSNYRNRFVRREILSEIAEDESIIWAPTGDVNFHTNDGLTTEHVFNSWIYDWEPDYLLEYSSDWLDPAVSPATPSSRWFVIEFRKVRGKQYKAILQRDIVADKYQAIIKAPAFIEKATLSTDDKFIYNSEGLSVNQIKTSEWLLKDATGIGWIVGYLSRVQPGETDLNIAISAQSKEPFDYTFSSFATLFGITITDPTSPISERVLKNGLIQTYKRNSLGFKYDDFIVFNNDGLASVQVSNPIQELPIVNTYTPAIINFSAEGTALNTLKVGYETGFNNRLSVFVDELVNEYNIIKFENANELINLNGKILFDGNANYYKINISPAGEYQDISKKTYIDAVGAVCQAMVSDAVSYFNSQEQSQITLQNGEFRLTINAQNYIITLTPYILGSVETNLAASRNQLEDAPYDMFCIPYGKITITNSSTELFKTNQSLAQLIAQAIGHQAGTRLLDLQLLPYFPITSLAGTTIDISTLTNDIDYSFIEKVETAGGTTTRTDVGIIFYCKRSSGNIAIDFSLFPEDIKIENECSMYRLCSPNYQGQFEFNLAKMGGISYFNVDFTYKPFNPYIHVNPDFSNLYGRQFGDARGLICGGDFSVAVATDQWAQYEINNKNYQNIFDRGIKNLEVMQRQERIGSVANAITGTIQGGATGAAAGSQGGAAGIIAGAVAGTTAAAIGGGVDLALLGERQREAKAYQIDMFNMQLQNIKAMPDSLTKSSALTANNKIFPFLEYYTCTEAEKEALRRKLKYNGMTVGRIGTIEEFLQADYSFIQCQLIRLEDASIDSHQWEAIYDELAKGVYIK